MQFATTKGARSSALVARLAQPYLIHSPYEAKLPHVDDPIFFTEIMRLLNAHRSSHRGLHNNSHSDAQSETDIDPDISENMSDQQLSSNIRTILRCASAVYTVRYDRDNVNKHVRRLQRAERSGLHEYFTTVAQDRSEDRDVVVAALLATGYLCGSDSVCDALLDQGFLSVLYRIQSRFPQHYDVQLACTYVVYALVERMVVSRTDSEADIQKDVCAQVYACAETALATYSDCVDIQARAIMVCTRVLQLEMSALVAEGSDSESVLACNPQIFLECVHRAMKTLTGNARVQTSGLLAWHRLCVYGLTTDSSDAATTVGNGSQSSSPVPIHTEVLNSRVSQAQSRIVDSIIMNKADTDVLRAMRRFPDKREVQSTGCQFFSLFCSSPRMNACAASHDSHVALQKTMQWHPQDLQLHTRAMRALIAFALAGTDSDTDGSGAIAQRVARLWEVALYRDVCATVECALREMVKLRGMGGDVAASDGHNIDSTRADTVGGVAEEVASCLTPSSLISLGETHKPTDAKQVVVIGCELIRLLYTHACAIDTTRRSASVRRRSSTKEDEYLASMEKLGTHASGHGYLWDVQAVLMDALEASPDDLCVQLCALQALCAFAGDDANLSGMNTKQGMSVKVVNLVLTAMDNYLHVCALQRVGCVFLIRVFENEQLQMQKGKLKAGCVTMGTAVRRANAHLIIQKAMRAHDQDLSLQAYACEALVGYCADENNVRKLGVSGLYLDVLSAMRGVLDSDRPDAKLCKEMEGDKGNREEAKTSLALQLAVCTVFDEFCVNKDNNKLAGMADVHLLLQQAMDRNLKCAKLQIVTCYTLAQYCRNEQNNGKSGESGLHRAVQRTMEMHANNENLQEAACMVLCRYYRSSENVQQGQADGVLDDMERAAVHFPDNVDIVSAHALACNYVELLEAQKTPSVAPGSDCNDNTDDFNVLRQRILSETARAGGAHTKKSGVRSAGAGERVGDSPEDEMEAIVWREQRDLINDSPKARTKRAAALKAKRIKLVMNACLILVVLSVVYGALWLITPRWIQTSMFMSLEHLGVVCTSVFLFYKKSREIYKTLVGAYRWMSGAEESRETRSGYIVGSRTRR
ncbi:hypothetical protein SARC_03991 [Sphaeroforma arctica JP610]|uniref:Uncharacterized protein n=1 Tax=Sphaeroforma arctica JP610 TaxID=667725 RepID=A0A0L0G3T1_9EUKA|nr:hypothetical protein SARC_03991 [Sphaeroforma arctica JP610]KNC83767.1 hypothetical protein SARC_03991 [Sphaeroforma arctica JP610]|eukprot:XP_014157669.1 hypothetical protein SARC_03991 [Sphaeroforma arctica JP610]